MATGVTILAPAAAAADPGRSTLIRPKTKNEPAAKERTSVFERQHKGANTQLRPALSENYESRITDRESWWRAYIRETPLPGAYNGHKQDTFLLELQKRPQTYSFKSDGRRLDADPFRKGAYLLPGAYGFEDLLSSIEKRQMTYCFHDTGREGKDMLNFGLKDKDIDVSPDAYPWEKLAAITCEKGSKTAQFKSTAKRFPTVYFSPKQGPGPGEYNSKLPQFTRAVTSSFSSTTPRFPTSHKKVPGPGTYEPTFQNPQSKTVESMGRQHGLFFSCSYQD